MKKIIYGILCSILLLNASCTDFMDNIKPTNSVTDEGIWLTESSAMLFMSKVYRDLDGPYYSVNGLNDHAVDILFTDDCIQIGERASNQWNLFDFNASSAPIDRWGNRYSSIRRANIALKNLPDSPLPANVKERLMGDSYFLRAMFYLELFRYYGAAILIDKPLDRKTDDIFLARATPEATLQFIISDFQNAADRLPVTVPDDELGRATKGAALGMMAVTYLYAAGIIDSKYYADAAKTARVLVSGDLKGTYSLYQNGFAEMFYEDNEHNSEVIFDIQFAYPYRWSSAQTVLAPPEPGTPAEYGWSKDHPTASLADEFEMATGEPFDWNNPEHAAAPYENRDKRFYATLHYNGKPWKNKILYTAQNTPGNLNLKENPNGMYSAGKPSCTKTGYYIGKYMNQDVLCGYDNRGRGVGGGHNFIVLRYAEILLTLAEAENEVNGPTAEVYGAINEIRARAGQPALPAGLDKSEMRKRIRHERRIELALEGKRWFDIQRWKIGEEVLNKDAQGCLVTYIKRADGEIVPTYETVFVCKKTFMAPRDYLLPIPQSARDKNPNLDQNPLW